MARRTGDCSVGVNSRSHTGYGGQQGFGGKGLGLAPRADGFRAPARFAARFGAGLTPADAMEPVQVDALAPLREHQRNQKGTMLRSSLSAFTASALASAALVGVTPASAA